MQLIDWFIRNPVKISVGVLLTCLFGVVAALRMPMQLTPEVSTPTLTIDTRWPGASPQDVEQEIIIEQEEYLRSIPSLERIISSASSGEGRIELEFPYNIDLNETLIRINNALSQVPSYPEDVDQPRVRASSRGSDKVWPSSSERMARTTVASSSGSFQASRTVLPSASSVGRPAPAAPSRIGSEKLRP